MRPESFNQIKDSIESTENASSNDDLSHLRFGFTKTAFDTDLDTLPDQPWKKPRVDISDYFNYGLTESSWKVISCSAIFSPAISFFVQNYCERQLRNRMEQGFGPAPPPSIPTVPSTPQAITNLL